MLTVGIALGAGVFYWLGMHNWAFWIIIFAILNGGLGTIRALVDPGWYYRGAFEAGVEPSYGMLLFTKAIVFAILLPIAWHLGRLAGYL